MPMPQITWDDVQQLSDDGNRYEAIEGALYVTPAPSVRHQTISRQTVRSRNGLKAFVRVRASPPQLFEDVFAKKLE